jgi:putative phage-type endonuclease
MPQIMSDQGTPEWLEARVGKITASTAGAILGVDPYQGPYWAFMEIMGRHKTPENRAMQYGKAHEQDARNWYECVTGEFVEPGGFWVSDIIPWLGASPDGFVGLHGMWEGKCPGKLPEVIPIHHEIQCRVQMAVCDRQFVDYMAWVDGVGHFLYRVERDLKAEDALLYRLKNFYEDHILPDIAPPRRRKSSESA